MLKFPRNEILCGSQLSKNAALCWSNSTKNIISSYRRTLYKNWEPRGKIFKELKLKNNMNFKPTLLKSVLSLLISVILTIIIGFVIHNGQICLLRVGSYCPTTSDIVLSLTGLVIFLISFIIIYIIWSLIQKSNSK